VDHGKVIALGTPAALIASLGAEHVIEFEVEGPFELASVLALPGIQDGRREENMFMLTATELHIAVPALLAELQRRGAVLKHLSTHHATLEDVFVSLTGRTLREA
jgi:ABC-2 type transport system ATP-binding protein